MKNLKKIKLFFKAIGPGIIIASACLGPGSITTASKIGADFGYELLWVVLISGICMGMYMSMSARYGAVNSTPILTKVKENYGRWFSVLIGISAFLASTSFQFGNNLGVATAMESMTGINGSIWPLIITPIGIVLVLFSKGLYRVVEKLMIILALTMIFAFVFNFAFTSPDWHGIMKGFVPLSSPPNAIHEMIAIVGTTFVLHACLYQSYLVQSKGWNVQHLKTGMKDSLLGIAILSMISILVILTSATALHPRNIIITSAADMAIQLETLFGPVAKLIFSLGLFAAAFSSLLVNSLMGGGMLADSLGLGKTMQDKYSKIFSTFILLEGMFVAVFFRGDIIYALVLAQASSMLAVPTIAIGLLMVANNKKIMGKYTNTWSKNVVSIIGLILVLFMVFNLYFKLYSLLGFGK